MSSAKPEAALTRTQRQQQRTRRLLLDAGRELVAANGVSGLRVQDVTERADIALGSFYNYFDSKDALLEAVISETLSAMAAATVADVELAYASQPCKWLDVVVIQRMPCIETHAKLANGLPGAA